MRLRVLILPLLFGWASSAAVKSAYDYAFNDDFARYQMMPLSAAAYAEDPDPCFKTAFPYGNASIHKIVHKYIDVSDTDSCKAFSAVSHNDKTIILAFRGTNGFVQLVEEGFETLWDSDKFIAGGRVAHYFNLAFKTVWDEGLKNAFLELRNTYPDYEVWITGHSLGGAMASLAAATIAHLEYVEKSKLKLLTFGQPRVGDWAFAKAHDSLVFYSYRVVHNRDTVPHVPPEHSPAAWFDGYRHHASEVFYKNDMKPGQPYTVCHEDEGKTCSDQFYFDPYITDHLHYYQDRMMFADFGEDGCPIELLKS
ncbi:hypothetical protein L596_011761 [Steinernema carpocapsae]|uniref:Fungal lipase-type domain-containing protein n=1 Tax=Steinernema carpocapsae TaxID=34508 RepID=A0A4U5NVP9_STECR|nr:hypothetical protein L596_011761 [Steinernema carpocapsae]